MKLSNPQLGQAEIDAVIKVLNSGQLSLGPETEKFEQIINKINKFNLFKNDFIVNQAKCEKCVYNNLC